MPEAMMRFRFCVMASYPPTGQVRRRRGGEGGLGVGLVRLCAGPRRRAGARERVRDVLFILCIYFIGGGGGICAARREREREIERVGSRVREACDGRRRQ